MSIDSLGPELLSRITGYLISPPRNFVNLDTPKTHKPQTAYAAVSRRFQEQVEVHTFRNITLRSCDTELRYFEDHFRQPRRKFCLRRLHYAVQLPTHGDSRANHERNVAAFDATIKALFDLLRSWDNDASEGKGIELVISTEYSVALDPDVADMHFDVTKSSAGHRFLTFTGVDAASPLPPLPCITALAVFGTFGKCLHPTAMCQLASVLPNLHRLELEYRDPANKRVELRREHRRALAAGLDGLHHLAQLSYLKIARETMTIPHNHSYELPDLTSGSGVDSLCAAVRRLTNNVPLLELHLKDILVSRDLFADTAADLDSSSWPSLRKFIVDDGIEAPDGKWYYTGDPSAVEPGEPTPLYSDDEDSDDNASDASSTSDDLERDAVTNGVQPTHEWRTRPDPASFDPLVHAMTCAVAARMPKLQLGSLEIGCRMHEPVGVMVRAAEGEAQLLDDGFGRRRESNDGDTRRLWGVWVGSDAEWEVPPDVKTMCGEWATEEGGVRMVTGWNMSALA